MLYKFLIKVFGLKNNLEKEIKKEIFIEPEYLYCTSLEESIDNSPQ